MAKWTFRALGNSDNAYNSCGLAGSLARQLSYPSAATPSSAGDFSGIHGFEDSGQHLAIQSKFAGSWYRVRIQAFGPLALRRAYRSCYTEPAERTDISSAEFPKALNSNMTNIRPAIRLVYCSACEKNLPRCTLVDLDYIFSISVKGLIGAASTAKF